MFKGPEKITRDMLPGYGKSVKKKRTATRNPLGDLVALRGHVIVSTEPGLIWVDMPIRTISESNQSEHWTVKYKRKTVQQDQLHYFWLQGVKSKFNLAPPYHVKFTRVGSRRIDPGNIEGAFKHVQDQLCRELGIDDGSSQISFEYGQDVVGRREYAVRIEIRSK